MKTTLHAGAALILFGATLGAGNAAAQAAAGPQQPAGQAAPASAPAATSVPKPGDSPRADAYYYFTLGHLQELEYQNTTSEDMAEQSIASYKKALELDPGSIVTKERLAEVYAESRHIRDAVIEAQEVLKADPNNVDAHRLLARIYVRTLGDMGAGEAQQENIDKAVAEFQAILKIDPTDTYSALWLARLYRFENRHTEAEQVLRGLIQRDPDNGPALEQLSQLLIDEGRSQEAIDLLTRSAGDSASPDIYDLLGDAYTQAKDYPKAEDAYRKAIELDPDDPGHRHGLAQALLSENKYAAALEQFKKLAELEPGTAENYLRMAQLDRRLGQYDDAESNLQHAKQLAPGSIEILYNEALLYEDQGRYDDAIKVLSDSIAGVKSQAGAGQASPNALAILYEQLGRAYSEAQNYPDAIDTFQEMAKLGPDIQKRAEILLINAYRDSHDVDRAITEAKKALGASPKDPDLTITLAMLYADKSDTPSGTQLLQTLLQGNANDQQIYLDIAEVDQRGRKFADAEQAAAKAEELAQTPDDKEKVWFTQGAIYEHQKKYDLAEQEFRKVLAASPDDAPTLNYLGYMLADRGVRLDEATSMIQRAVKQEPSNGAYLDSLGWAYYKQNKLTEAEEYCRKAVDREGHDPTILSHLGAVYVKLGQDERAGEILERSLAEWQKVVPGDYEADKVSEVEAQLRTVKRRLAQKMPAVETKPQ
ncbi:MAG TPA: tetratricopeptide repeat protein [Candidatus Acidoferrales bacterium]|nr:tetratricopeptide repeat protein [Candidatus Acidoferrales bacterium]